MYFSNYSPKTIYIYYLGENINMNLCIGGWPKKKELMRWWAFIFVFKCLLSSTDFLVRISFFPNENIVTGWEWEEGGLVLYRRGKEYMILESTCQFRCGSTMVGKNILLPLSLNNKS